MVKTEPILSRVRREPTGTDATLRREDVEGQHRQGKVTLRIVLVVQPTAVLQRDFEFGKLACR